MIFAEILALMGFGVAALMGAITLASRIKQRRFTNCQRRKRQDEMLIDLRTALEEQDPVKLDNWLVLYSDLAEPIIKSVVEERRDDLYLEKNNVT